MYIFAFIQKNYTATQDILPSELGHDRPGQTIELFLHTLVKLLETNVCCPLLTLLTFGMSEVIVLRVLEISHS